MLKEILARGLVEDFESKSFFDLYSIYLEERNIKMLENIIKPYLDSYLCDMMPEEVVILCGLLKKHSDTAFSDEVYKTI